MVKTFIQTIESHDWFSQLRQLLAATLIFSMLAPDIAKAMEDDLDEMKVVHSIPLLLKGPSKAGIIISSEDQKPLNTSMIPLAHDDTETHIIQFASQSSGSDENHNKDISFGSTDSSPEKSQSKSSAIIPYIALSILPSTSQDIPPSSFSPPSLPKNIESSVDSRSLQDREQPLPLNHSNHSDQSSDEEIISTTVSPPISHPLDINLDPDEEGILLENKHHQSKDSVSIRQSDNIVKLTFQREHEGDQFSVDFIALGSSEIPSSPHFKQKESQTKTKKLDPKPFLNSNSLRNTEPPSLLFFSSVKDAQERKRLQDTLIGQESSPDIFVDTKDTKRSNNPTIPPISIHNLPSISSSKSAVVNERTSLLESQPSIQRGDHDTDQSEDDEISIEIVYSGNPDDSLYLAPSEDHSQYKSCCGFSSKRPFCHKHTEYTLPNLEQHFEDFSRLVALIKQGHPPHSEDEIVSNSPNSSFEIDSEGSSPLNGSPTKKIRVGDGISLDDTDEERASSDDLTTGISRNLSNLGFPQENNRLDHLPGDASSYNQLPSTDIEALTTGVPAAKIALFREFLKKLPPSATAQLKHFMHQIFDGKSTWPQRLGKWVIGPIVGGVFAYMMGPVYDGGIGYLSTQGEIFNKFITGNAIDVLLAYIAVSAIFDGIPRNAHLWKNGIAYFSQEGKEIGRMCVAGGISFLTAFIPPTYLITSEEYAIQILGLHGWDNVFVRTMLVGCPFLYLDAFASDFNSAWGALPQIREWLGKLLCHKFLQSRIQAPEEITRERFNCVLDKLAHFLFRAPSVVIDEIYHRVKQFKDDLRTESSDEPDENLVSRQAFVALSFLLSSGDQVVKGVTHPQSIYDTSVEFLKYACMISGSPARAIALQFIGATVFGLFCPDGVAQALGGAFALLAFLPQTYLENQGMDNFFKRFLVEEDPHGHSSHPVYRGITKLFVALQGLIYVFPLAVLTLQAFQTWFGDGWWPLAVGIPFLIPEFAAQAYSFNGTFNQQVATSITNVHNTKTRKCLGKEPRSDWKRDWLLRFIKASQEDLKQWHPTLIHELDKNIEILQRQESQSLFADL